MILTGLARLGRDAELRFTQDGKPVATLALAYDVGFGDRKKTQWVEATLWGQSAERLQPYLLKGQQINITLSDVCIEEYQHNGKTGVKMKGRVIPETLTFAGSKPEGGQQQSEQPRQQQSRPAPQPQQQRGNPVNDFEDDIPF